MVTIKINYTELMLQSFEEIYAEATLKDLKYYAKELQDILSAYNYELDRIQEYSEIWYDAQRDMRELKEELKFIEQLIANKLENN